MIDDDPGKQSSFAELLKTLNGQADALTHSLTFISGFNEEQMREIGKCSSIPIILDALEYAPEDSIFLVDIMLQCEEIGDQTFNGAFPQAYRSRSPLDQKDSQFDYCQLDQKLIPAAIIIKHLRDKGSSFFLVSTDTKGRQIADIEKFLGESLRSGHDFPIASNDVHLQTKLEGWASRILELVEQTPLEKIWSNKEACEWFDTQGQNPPHNWNGPASSDYVKRISSVLTRAFPHNFPQLPDSLWTETFHESIKGVAGGTFCASSCGSRGNELRLGGVVFIAMMAYAVERGQFGPFEAIWCQRSESIVDRPFLSHKRSAETRATCLALWWFFRRLFQKDRHCGETKNVKPLKLDGFEITLNWETEVLFDQAKEQFAVGCNRHKTAASSPCSSLYRAPEKTCEALSVALAALACEPGRLLSCHYGLRIQAVQGD